MVEAVGCQPKTSSLEVSTTSQPMRMIRADKACVYILDGDTGITEMDSVTGSIYLGDPGVGRSCLII